MQRKKSSRSTFPSHRSVPMAMAIILCLAITQIAIAIPITHTPADGPNPAPFSPAAGPVAVADQAGTRYVSFGVDYTAAGVVGVFNDPPPAFGGVNGGGIMDLVSSVVGRIVLLNTTTQGLTDSVTVEAGEAPAGGLLLEVFDINGSLLSSQPNPTDNFSTWGITDGLSDIASFRVSTPGQDTFGVDQVTINTPVATPEPSTVVLAGLGLVSVGFVALRKKYRRA